MPVEAGKYFDPETGVLQAPMIITVADQVKFQRPSTNLIVKENTSTNYFQDSLAETAVIELIYGARIMLLSCLLSDLVF